MSTRRLLPAPLLLLLVLTAAPQDESEPQPTAVRFASARTTLRRDRSAVLHFAVEPAATRDLALDATVEPAGALEVLRPPSVVAGETRGSLRVRAVAEGTCRVSVGGAVLEVAVRPSPPVVPEPRIVVPVEGAVVWDRFAVGVEVPSAPSATPCDTSVRLALPGGATLDAVRASSPDGTSRHALFEVDAAALAPGPQVLRAVVANGAGELADASVAVTVVHPAPGSVLAGECEDALDAPRPAAFGAGAPGLGAGSGASGDRYVVQSTPDPQWVLPLEVPAAGLYQLVLRVRGDHGAGAFPSFGVGVDEPYPLLGATRVADHGWHRVPAGPPIELEAGPRALGVRYVNERNVGPRADRNLYLDRWELLAVAAPAAGGAGAPAAMAETMSAEPSGTPTPMPARGGGGLWVALERPLDGLAMNGRLVVEGACNWSGPADAPAPDVELWVDGAVVASQQAAKPRFVLERAQLGEGVHEVSLAAHLFDGRSARTPVQRIVVPGPVAPRAPRAFARFSVLDARWDDAMRAVLDGQGEEARQRVARPLQPVETALGLPEALAGELEVLVEARGPGGGRVAKVGVRIEADGATVHEHELSVQHWWDFRAAGRVTLPEGPKRLVLRMEPSETEPQLRVRSVAFRTPAEPDREPPTARVLYPPPAHRAHGVDAVVVEAFDDGELESADVLIDGRPQGTFGHVPAGAGSVVLPLLLRDVPPGEHALAVRVFDREGNVAQTGEIPFTVLADAPGEPGPYARAVHLLNRLAFGPDPGELAEILAAGEEAWLEGALDDRGTGDETARELADARLGDALGYQADRLVLSWALRTDNPLRARLVLWVDDHFSTWAGKTGAPSEWGEHRGLARLGPAPFHELLLASATSPTMLHYLDQAQSVAGRRNENYARELLELHTVGLDGGYGEEDVTALARLLCGLTVNEEAPADGSGEYRRRVLSFDPDLSDGRPCTVLGRRFETTPPGERYDRVGEVLELLASHPSTARSVATRLAEHTVSAPAPEPLVTDLATVFLESGGDLREVLRALARHPLFWSATGSPRLATPLDYALRVARAAEAPAVDWSMRQFLRDSGMGLFDRATPDGYPDDDGAWADTNGMVQRWRWVQSVHWAVRALVPDPARRYAGGDPLAWRQRIVDHAAVRLTGWTLGAESNAAALEYLAGEESPPWQQVDRATVLVCRLPEANLK